MGGEAIGEWLKKQRTYWKEPKHRRLFYGLIALFFYLSGLLAQFLNNRYHWRFGEQLLLPSLNPLKGLAMLFTPFGVQATLGLFCFLLISGLLFYLFREDRSHLTYDRKRKFYYSTYGTYGTAGWMDDKTLTECFDLTPEKHAPAIKEIIYGEKDGMLISRKPDSMLNRHTALIGSSGSMKSRAFIRNAIIASALKGESMVITDPKSELLCDTRLYLEDKGYAVKVLNLVNPAQSDRFDALHGALENPLMVSHVVDAIIANTGGPKGDHFFDAAEGNLLMALIFYLMEVRTGQYPTLGDAYSILMDYSSLEAMDKLCQGVADHHRCKKCYNLFCKGSDNVRGNIITGLGSRLSILQNHEIAELLSFPDMDFIQPGKEKCAYFLIISDQDNTMKFITSMFFTLSFFHLVRYADNECEGKKLPVAVNFIMDEFCNLGFIKDINIKISTVRSRNIALVFAIQGIMQLQNRYPDGMWSELLGNCDTIVFLGTTEPESAEFISDRTGEVSIAVDTVMKQRSLFMPLDIQPNYRQSEGVGRRMLLTPDEVLRMAHDEMLIILRGKQVLEAKKFDYTRNPESRKFRPYLLETAQGEAEPDRPAFSGGGQSVTEVEVEKRRVSAKEDNSQGQPPHRPVSSPKTSFHPEREDAPPVDEKLAAPPPVLLSNGKPSTYQMEKELRKNESERQQQLDRKSSRNAPRPKL